MAVETTVGDPLRPREAQAAAYYVTLSLVPLVVTDGAPASGMVDLHVSWRQTCA